MAPCRERCGRWATPAGSPPLAVSCAGAWEEVEGFDPGFFLYFEDADFGLRLRQAGWRLAQVAEARAYHDKHGPGGTSDRLLRYREAQFRYYRKHRRRWESRLLLAKQRRAAARIADPRARERTLEVCERAESALDRHAVDVGDSPVKAAASAERTADAGRLRS
jgi:GT2 family glycosyltransferase